MPTSQEHRTIVRALYAEGKSIAEICNSTGLGQRRVYLCLTASRAEARAARRVEREARQAVKASERAERLAYGVREIRSAKLIRLGIKARHALSAGRSPGEIAQALGMTRSRFYRALRTRDPLLD